ncbi:DUF1116 domain-containing protein [Nocardioides sp.]|uniref:DUF1116 domain-containing protein n=1 Tax=Nocardioides sp. TaxID=35761 RepID=UPI0025EC3C3E|nr:DUF1116 domain-containing protein [Nocardioides sp.]
MTTPAAVVNVGADLLADAVADQAVPVTRVDWRPPMVGTDADLATVAADPRRRAANEQALAAMLGVTATLVDVLPASEALGLEPGQFLHAGPPIAWERASGPLRGALMGGAALEGLVEDPEDAVALFESGAAVSLEPCHHRSTVGPMAGVVTPSMWMFVLEDAATGRRTYCSLNEGLGKVLRYGAYGPEVLARLRWMSAVLGPLLQAAVRAQANAGADPVDVTGILTQMLQMGDEAHNRNRAGTLMLLRDLSPAMVSAIDGRGFDSADVAAALRFIGGNDHFFLNLAMPACKLALDAARGIEGSTMVVAMARNGTDFGIQVAGTGDEWFTGPAQLADGLFLGDYGPEDANPDIGDSAITDQHRHGRQGRRRRPGRRRARHAPGRDLPEGAGAAGRPGLPPLGEGLLGGESLLGEPRVGVGAAVEEPAALALDEGDRQHLLVGRLGVGDRGDPVGEADPVGLGGESLAQVRSRGLVVVGQPHGEGGDADQGAQQGVAVRLGGEGVPSDPVVGLGEPLLRERGEVVHRVGRQVRLDHGQRLVDEHTEGGVDRVRHDLRVLGHRRGDVGGGGRVARRRGRLAAGRSVGGVVGGAAGEDQGAGQGGDRQGLTQGRGTPQGVGSDHGRAH